MATQTNDASTGKKARSTPTFVKYYLVAYNVLSAVAWSYLLLGVLVHVLDVEDRSTKADVVSSFFTRFLEFIYRLIGLPPARSTVIESTIHSNVPMVLVPYIQNAKTTYATIGRQTAIVQSFAALEVLHVLLGWVRSPLPTTAAQVSSRLFLVWKICNDYEAPRTNPLYASMVFAWSLTEVIRYSFYAFSLLGMELSPLVWLRYTTFFLLYPLGASSEAFLIYSTLPRSSPNPSERNMLSEAWEVTDYVRAGLFAVWWPGLYVMYTYMIKQRRKVWGGGQRLGATSQAKIKTQ